MRTSRGFTLIEVLIAAAILAAMGAATFGMFKQQYTQKETTEAIDDRLQPRQPVTEIGTDG